MCLEMCLEEGKSAVNRWLFLELLHLLEPERTGLLRCLAVLLRARLRVCAVLCDSYDSLGVDRKSSSASLRPGCVLSRKRALARNDGRNEYLREKRAQSL